MKPKVYIETSIISYLTARPSRDLITVARQELTWQWWENQRRDYDLYVSEFVVQEVGDGDPHAAERRLEILRGVPEIAVSEDAMTLARALLADGPLPEKAAVDAFHIAVAVTGGVDYLLTWNFKHLANAVLRIRIEELCRSRGYEPSVICTPEELLGE